MRLTCDCAWQEVSKNANLMRKKNVLESNKRCPGNMLRKFEISDKRKSEWIFGRKFTLYMYVISEKEVSGFSRKIEKSVSDQKLPDVLLGLRHSTLLNQETGL